MNRWAAIALAVLSFSAAGADTGLVLRIQMSGTNAVIRWRSNNVDSSNSYVWTASDLVRADWDFCTSPVVLAGGTDFVCTVPAVLPFISGYQTNPAGWYGTGLMPDSTNVVWKDSWTSAVWTTASRFYQLRNSAMNTNQAAQLLSAVLELQDDGAQLRVLCGVLLGAVLMAIFFWHYFRGHP